VSSDQVAAFGAFLSGAGSVLGAVFVIRSMRKRMERECRERLELYKQGLARGEEHDRVHTQTDTGDRDAGGAGPG
jgi:hypothetical protein